MLGPLTYVTVAALTRQRLASIERLLLAKIKSQQNVSPLERQIHFLARSASDALGVAPNLPNEQTLPSFARGLSLYSVVGSSGPSLPQFAAMFAPGQRWLSNTVSGGNPDPNRQRVLAGSTDLLVRLAERGAASINASDSGDKATELRHLHAYILGHAAHLATDVVSAPFVNATAWELGTVTRNQVSSDQVADAIDKAAAQLFRRDLVTTPTLAARGDLYRDWWLSAGALPPKFFDAFKDALEATYGPAAQPVQRASAAGANPRTPQVSPSFWDQFRKDAPPDLSVRLLEDGYASFVSVVESRYTWNYGDWLAATALMFIPPIAAYPLIVALPHTRGLFKDGALIDGRSPDTDLGWFGLVMAPLATSALAPVALSAYIAAFSYFGVGRETVFGWIAGGVNLVTSIAGLASLGSDVNAVVRWLLLFGVPFGGLLTHSIYVLGRGGSDPRHIQLALGSLIPCIVTAVYVLFHLAFHQSQSLGMNGWLSDDHGHPDGWDNGGFIGGWVLWAVLLIGAWLILARALMHAKDPDPAADQFVSGQKHFLRLFGHSTLFFDANLAQDANAPSLAAHYFPTGRRPLLKLWWTGAGDLYMRSERNTLLFSTTADGTGNPQAILAPAAPMTAAEFGNFLTRAVKEGANFSQGLHTTLFDARDFDYVLPPGEVFADNGDEKTTVAEHDTDASLFVKLKTAQDDPTVLFHAPSSHVAAFQGQHGPVLVDTDRGAPVAGSGQITFPGGNVNGDANTRFTTFFQPGDLIATVGVGGGDQTRIVASVQDDANLIVTQPFTFGLPAAVTPQSYRRGVNTRDLDTRPGTLRDTAAFRAYQGTNFDQTFMVGDTVRALSITPPLAGDGSATFGANVVGTNTLFTTFFQVGDIIATRRAPTDEFRVVTGIVSDTQLNVNAPFSAAMAASGSQQYQRYRGRPGPGTATFAGSNVLGNNQTRFRSLFKRGDVIVTVGAGNADEARIVDIVLTDATLTVTTPFTAGVGGGPLSYLQLAATFDEQRTATSVISSTQLTLDKPLMLPMLPAATTTEAACWRVGRVTREGFGYVPQTPLGVFAGDSLMERAADLGAILCMGATTHMLSTAERQAVVGGADETQRPAVNPVYQVFRNWNLNQRRLNEWNMLVAGGAVSEKRGAPDKADPLQPAAPAAYSALTPTGEAVANRLGWVPLMQKWLDVARRPGVSSVADEAFREGDPTNKALSEAVAFLFDLPMPA